MTTTIRRSGRARPLSPVVGAIALLVALGVATARAQEENTVFSDVTTVSVVEVPVQVLVKGQPVRGLTAENFVLLDEGEQRLPFSFEVIDLTLPSGSREARLAPSPSLAARRKFLFVFDLNFTRPRDALVGAAGARAMIAQLAPSDLVAIGCISSRQGLQMVLNFTSDKARARDVLDGFSYLLGDESRGRDDGTENAKRDPLRLSTGGWSASVAEVGRALLGDVSTAELEGVADARTGRGLETGSSQGGSEGRAMGAFLRANLLGNMAAFGRQDIQNQEGSLVVRMADAFADLARRTRGVPGQKHMVLVSSGFDEELFNARLFYREAIAGAGTWVLAAVDEGLGEMRRAGWLVHPVVPRGGMASQFKRSGLFHLAAETGGTLFERYDDLGAAMGRLERETAVTYVLSFQPEDLSAEPAYRRLKVELVGGPRGADLHHKDGYYTLAAAPAQGSSGAQWQIGSLLAGGGEIDQLGVRVVAVPVDLSGAETRVAVLFDVPGEGLLGGAESQAQVDLFVYAFEEEGRVRDFLATHVDLDSTRHHDRLAGGLRFAGELRLPPGTYRLRFGVHGLASGRLAVITREMTIPGAGVDRPRLYPPFFLVSEDRDLLLWRSSEEGDAETPFPFQLGRVRLNPSARLTGRSAEPIHLAVVGLGLAGHPLTARVLGADGSDMPVTITAVGGLPAEDGLPDVHLLKLETDGLAAGTYTLELGLGDVDEPVGAFAAARAVFEIAS